MSDENCGKTSSQLQHKRRGPGQEEQPTDLCMLIGVGLTSGLFFVFAQRKRTEDVFTTNYSETGNNCVIVL